MKYTAAHVLSVESFSYVNATENRGEFCGGQNTVHRLKQLPTGKIRRRVEMESTATKSENQRWGRNFPKAALSPRGRWPEIPPTRVIAILTYFWMLLSIKGYFTRRLLGESAIKDKQLVRNKSLSPGLTFKYHNWLSLDRIKIEIVSKVRALETSVNKRKK